jgi:hypothetical protein
MMRTPVSSSSTTPVTAPPRTTFNRRGGSSRSTRFAAAFLCAAAIFAGCQTTTEKMPRGSTGSSKSHSGVTTGNGSVEYAKPMVVEERPASSKNKSSPSAQARRNEDPLDDCAERLHSLCGPLLFYYMQNHHLPVTLQDLPANGPEPVPPLMCPESHKPYVYSLKNPIFIDNPRGYIIVHDPVPAHNGVRWCIVASPGDSATEPIIVKSVGIREDRFAVLRSKALSDQKDIEREQQKAQPQQQPPPASKR